MKRYKFNQWIVVLVAVLTVSFTACSDDDEDSGSGQVILEAFGPSPALRGSDLTFIGNNMDKVISIIFPDDIEVADIEVVSNEKIKVTIPQDAEEGYVKLKTPSGEITTKTLLDYTEPISISEISPNPVKAGQTLTIEGDYLNLIQKVIFADDVTVESDDFTIWKRAMIELVVPKEAKTGTIMLSDTASTPIELESETILQITLPSVSSVEKLENRKPGDEISVNGADLDLVNAVVLANSDSVEFVVSGNTLSFTLPAGTPDGIISMETYSGVAIPVVQVTMAVPTELVASPSVDLRSGDVITVSGVNMDLVTVVTFPGTTDAVSPLSIETDKITIEMPDAAISGDLILNTASGNTAKVAITTLKPEVTSYTPSPVSAGNDLTLTGTKLDLVTSVTFPGDLSVEVMPSSATSLTLTVPVDAGTGVLTLTMGNGETVECPSLTVEKPEFCYIPVLPDSETEINAGTILPVEVYNADKLTDVQVSGNSTQYILQETTLYVLIPDNAGGNTELTLISSNGEVTYEISVIGNSTVETVIMDEIRDLGSWAGEDDGGAFRLYKSSFTDVPAGSVLKFYFTVTGAGQMQINDANWGQQGAILEFNDASQNSYEMELTQDFLNHIFNTDDGWSETALVIQGQDLIVSKVSVITTGASSETLWEGEVVLGNWSGSTAIEASAFAKAQVGSSIIVSVKDLDASYTWWQVALKDGSDWSDITIADLASDDTAHEFVIDESLLDVMQTNGLIFSGCYCTITKIEIKY